MTKERWTKLLIDLAASGFLLMLLLFVLRLYNVAWATAAYNKVVTLLTVVGVNPASDTDPTNQAAQATGWQSEVSGGSDYFNFNYYPPNQVPAGIAPNPLAPSSTQTIGGAAGQCMGCGG